MPRENEYQLFDMVMGWQLALIQVFDFRGKTVKRIIMYTRFSIETSGGCSEQFLKMTRNL